MYLLLLQTIPTSICPDIFLDNGDAFFIFDGDVFYKSHIYTFWAKKHIGYWISSAGWKKFVHHYELKAGDVCLFRFDFILHDIHVVSLSRGNM